MATQGSLKQLLNEQFSKLGRAIGNANRLEIIEYLAQGERNVENLSKLSGLSIANTSQHLAVLRQAGLVTSRKEGLYVIYSLAGPDVVALFGLLRSVAENRVAEVDRLIGAFLNTKDHLEPIDAEELLARAQEGSISILDVRPKEEFEAGHLVGAVNISLAELEQQWDQFPPGNEVIAYCRGPYCVLSFDAVAGLRAKGIKARRLKEGFPEWKLAGHPINVIT